MSRVVYVALVSQAGNSGYRATFPDLPDCAAEGADIAELLLDARQRLLACLEAIEARGDAWPSASPIESVRPGSGAMAIPIDVAVDDPPIRVNISLGERLVQRLDEAAAARGMTRSGFIAQAVRANLGETVRGARDFEAMGRRLQDELAALGRRIHDNVGPESPLARRMNGLDGVVYENVRKAADNVSAAMSRRRHGDAAADVGDGATPTPGP